MQRLVEINCITCKTRFMPKSEKNKYCCRKCFKKDNYHKNKAKELAAAKFPGFLCPVCKKYIELDFDPVADSYRWLHYECPGCKAQMVDVSDQIEGSPSPSVAP